MIFQELQKVIEGFLLFLLLLLLLLMFCGAGHQTQGLSHERQLPVLRRSSKSDEQKTKVRVLNKDNIKSSERAQ